MSKLLPCPFCGSQDVHGHYHGVGHDFVECHSCGVTGSKYTHATAAEATTAWNTRTPDAQHNQVIAELVAALNWFADKHEHGTCGRQIAQDAIARAKALENNEGETK